MRATSGSHLAVVLLAAFVAATELLQDNEVERSAVWLCWNWFIKISCLHVDDAGQQILVFR